jgi:NAD(P)-dependent dehydrogenase (short-subunit alcohol dehydrogenase family)
VPYRTSKAALNMLTACQDYEYGPKGWKVFCFCPGFTESNLGPMVCCISSASGFAVVFGPVKRGLIPGVE